MLKIFIQGEELYDESTEEFSTVDDIVLELEHSLVSLSKWESEFQTPFLSGGEKTSEEILGYVRAMIITPNVDVTFLWRLDQKNLDLINDYIDSKQSATTFGNMPEYKGIGETITSELIYYWMIAFGIPFECQYWHINRLFALIRVCNIKNSKPKKMSKHDLALRNRELNTQRRAELGTSG